MKVARQNGKRGPFRTRRNKYNVADKEERTFNDRVYASKAERIRAEELQLLMQAGEVRRIVEQPRFELGIPENRYIADFKVTNRHGFTWVEDVKGVETAKFRHNKRLWKRYGGYPLVILKRSGRSWEREVVQPPTGASPA